MSSILLSVPHWQQRMEGECLPASVAMILEYKNIPFNYHDLLNLFDIIPKLGTPFFRIERLSQIGIPVSYQPHGVISDLRKHLDNNDPCLVSVHTGQLPYWSYGSRHALVVVGMDDQTVFVNDPAFKSAPIQVSLGDFDLAWFEGFERFAVVTL